MEQLTTCVMVNSLYHCCIIQAVGVGVILRNLFELIEALCSSASWKYDKANNIIVIYFKYMTIILHIKSPSYTGYLV